MTETKRQTKLFYTGWLLFFALAPFGNTSVGALMLLLNSFYEIKRGNRQFGIYKDRYFYKLALFVLVMIISSIISIQPGKALLFTFGFMLVLYVALFEGRYLILEKDFLYSILIRVLLISAAISGAYSAIVYLVFKEGRGHTLFAGVNGTGTLLAASFALGLGYFDYLLQKNRQESPKETIKTGMELAAIGTGLLATFSRGAWVGTFFSSVFYVLRSKQMRQLLVIGVIAVIVLTAVSTPFQERLYSIFSIEENMDRIIIWQTSLKMIADHPIFGIGTFLFAKHWDATYRPPDYDATIVFAHNIILQKAVEFGIVGLVIFCLIIADILLTAFKALDRMDRLYRGLTAAFIAIFIHQQFDCTIYGLEQAALFWLISTLLVYLPSQQSQERTSRKSESLID